MDLFAQDWGSATTTSSSLISVRSALVSTYILTYVLTFLVITLFAIFTRT